MRNIFRPMFHESWDCHFSLFTTGIKTISIQLDMKSIDFRLSLNSISEKLQMTSVLSHKVYCNDFFKPQLPDFLQFQMFHLLMIVFFVYLEEKVSANFKAKSKKVTSCHATL